MKLRFGFVSNSSSASFIIAIDSGMGKIVTVGDVRELVGNVTPVEYTIGFGDNPEIGTFTKDDLAMFLYSQIIGGQENNLTVGRVLDYLASWGYGNKNSKKTKITEYTKALAKLAKIDKDDTTEFYEIDFGCQTPFTYMIREKKNRKNLFRNIRHIYLGEI
jgi:hypothetical protein